MLVELYINPLINFNFRYSLKNEDYENIIPIEKKDFVENTMYIKNWFSNMNSCNSMITDDMGIKYHTVENYYQANKSLDKSIREYISLMNPYESKKFGRSIKIRDDWEKVKLSIMETALRQKFAPGTSYHDRLMGDNEPIIENNNWGDRYWGICNGKGENHLGKLLMKIREEFKNEI